MLEDLRNRLFYRFTVGVPKGWHKYLEKNHLDILSELKATNYLLLNLVKQLGGNDLTNDYVRIAYGVARDVDVARIKNSFWWLRKLTQNKTDDCAYQNQE